MGSFWARFMFNGKAFILSIRNHLGQIGIGSVEGSQFQALYDVEGYVEKL